MPSRSASRKDGITKAKRPKLTKAQLEKKRECDREAQRQIRLKTKNRISHLESLVASLQSAQKNDTHELVEQVKAGQKEITRLSEIIRGISRLVGSAALAQDSLSQDTKHRGATAESDHIKTSSSPNNDDTPPPEPVVVTPFAAEESFTESESLWNGLQERSIQPLSPPGSPPPPSTYVGSVNGAVNQDLDVVDLGGDPPIFDDQTPVFGQNAEQLAITDKINTIANQIIHDRTLEGRLWYLAGSLLSFILTMPRKYQTPREFEEDIPVRAVLHGWHAVVQRYYLDPGWLWLRHLDEALYSSMGIPERLATMRIVRMIYLTQLQPHLATDLPLPGFLEAPPAQRFLAHDPLVEHWVWPGFREHLLFGPRKYATNNFMENFRAHCRFLWPHNPEDTFVRNTLTGLYSYSPDFAQRQSDIRFWCMRPDFFERFPELTSDIPKAGHVPSVPFLLTHLELSPCWKQQNLLLDDQGQSEVEDEMYPLTVSGSPDASLAGFTHGLPGAISSPQELEFV